MTADFLQYTLIDLLSNALPRRAAYAVGVRFSRIFYNRNSSLRSAVISNIRQVHAAMGLAPSEEELARLALKTFENFGKHLADFFRLSLGSKSELERLVRVEGRHFIDQARAHGRGVICLTAHLGNWEIAPLMTCLMGYPSTMIVIPMKHADTNALFQKHRESRGSKVILLGNAARGMIEALKRNELVGVAGDIDFTMNDHIVPFLGRPARMPSGPARLCVRLRSPIMPGFVFRREDDTYLFQLFEPIVPDDRTTQGDVQETICRILGEQVKRHPDQWSVFHDFWDTNAPDLVGL